MVLSFIIAKDFQTATEGKKKVVLIMQQLNSVFFYAAIALEQNVPSSHSKKNLEALWKLVWWSNCNLYLFGVSKKADF